MLSSRNRISASVTVSAETKSDLNQINNERDATKKSFGWSRKFDRFLAETETSPKLLFLAEIGRNRIFDRKLATSVPCRPCLLYRKRIFKRERNRRMCLFCLWSNMATNDHQSLPKKSGKNRKNSSTQMGYTY
jgi:hypothetical protein